MILAARLQRLKLRLYTPIVRNIFWLSLDKVLKLVVGLVVGIWIARYLGPAQWGELNYVFAFVTIIATVDKLGMDGFLAKEILENPIDKNSILGTSFAMRMFFIPFLIGSVLIYFYSLNLAPGYYYLLAFLSLNVIVIPFDLIDVDFQSRLQSKSTVIAKNIAYVLGAAVKIGLLVANKPLVWFAAAIGIEAVISYLFLVIFYQRQNNIFAWNFSLHYIKRLWLAGWPFIISSLAIILYMRLDQVMLGSMASPKELGLFSSVVRISDIFIFLPMAIAGSVLPSLIQAKKNGEEIYMAKMTFFINWMTRLAVAPALLVTVFSGYLISLLYGPDYMEAGKVLVVHIWSLVPIFLGIATGEYLIIENLQKFTLYRTLLGLFSNIGLNLLLIPEFGAFGAALATTISQFVASILSMALFKQTRILFYLQLKSFLMILNFQK